MSPNCLPIKWDLLNTLLQCNRDRHGKRKMEPRSLTIPCSFSLYAFTFLLLISNNMQATSASKSNYLKTYKSFIKTSCNSTTYPSICYKSLSSYASTIKTDSLKLCKTALAINLKVASKTSSLLSSIVKQGGLSPGEKAVTKDCVEEIGDSIDELKQALSSMDKIRDSGVMDDIKTWVSAAVTDEDTCTGEFDEKKVRASLQNKIKKSVVNLGKITSNSLALINKLRY